MTLNFLRTRELLRSVLCGAEPELGLFKNMTSESWTELILYAYRQSVLGLVAEAVLQLPEEMKPEHDLQLRLAVEQSNIENFGKKIVTEGKKLCSYFRKQGLTPIVMKGPAAAKHYPNPLLRETGDLDIYFKGEEFNKATELVCNLGIPVQTCPDKSIAYNFQGITVEHHRDYYDCKIKEFDGIEINSAASKQMMLSAHILKHVLGHGIGLRQVCDYALAKKQLKNNESDIFRAMVKTAGLEKWQTALDEFSEYLLGCNPAGKDGLNLGEIIDKEGNFGLNTDKEHPLTNRDSDKLGTLALFLKKIPFALQYAPREWIFTVTSLLKGNLKLSH